MHNNTLAFVAIAGTMLLIYLKPKFKGDNSLKHWILIKIFVPKWSFLYQGRSAWLLSEMISSLYLDYIT